MEELLHNIELTADPALRATVQKLVELVMTLHGAGLERILELVRSTGDLGDVAIEKLGRDELVASILVLHGLHPLNTEARVAQAVEKAGSRLRPHGAVVELLSLQGDVIRLRLQITGCGSSQQSLKKMVEEAVYQAAPELSAIIVESPEETHSFVTIIESAGKGRV